MERDQMRSDVDRMPAFPQWMSWQRELALFLFSIGVVALAVPIIASCLGYGGSFWVRYILGLVVAVTISQVVRFFRRRHHAVRADNRARAAEFLRPLRQFEADVAQMTSLTTTMRPAHGMDGEPISQDRIIGIMPNCAEPPKPAFKCPLCGLASYHPRDNAEQFCARCGFVEDLVVIRCPRCQCSEIRDRRDWAKPCSVCSPANDQKAGT